MGFLPATRGPRLPPSGCWIIIRNQHLPLRVISLKKMAKAKHQLEARFKEDKHLGTARCLPPAAGWGRYRRPCPFPGKWQKSLWGGGRGGGQLSTAGRMARGQGWEPSSRQHIRAKHATAIAFLSVRTTQRRSWDRGYAVSVDRTQSGLATGPESPRLGEAVLGLWRGEDSLHPRLPPAVGPQATSLCFLAGHAASLPHRLAVRVKHDAYAAWTRLVCSLLLPGASLKHRGGSQ